MLQLEREGRIYTGSKVAQLKRYLDELDGQAVNDIWTDVAPTNPQAAERMDFPTQKLNRQWVGIDITYLSIDLIAGRLRKTGLTEGKDFVTKGAPADVLGADFGILVTLQEPTDGMRTEARKAGVYKYNNQREIPRLQLVSAADLFKEFLPLQLPPEEVRNGRKMTVIAEPGADDKTGGLFGE
jgi:hypothetical protein